MDMSRKIIKTKNPKKVVLNYSKMSQNIYQQSKMSCLSLIDTDGLAITYHCLLVIDIDKCLSRLSLINNDILSFVI